MYVDASKVDTRLLLYVFLLLSLLNKVHMMCTKKINVVESFLVVIIDNDDRHQITAGRKGVK